MVYGIPESKATLRLSGLTASDPGTNACLHGRPLGLQLAQPSTLAQATIGMGRSLLGRAQGTCTGLFGQQGRHKAHDPSFHNVIGIHPGTQLRHGGVKGFQGDVDQGASVVHSQPRDL
jgi:hypothetical protein